MEDFSSVSEGCKIHVRFVDEKGFNCDVTGEVVGFDENFAVCECMEDNEITRFRVSVREEQVEILLSDSSVLRYDTSSIERHEIEGILEKIDNEQIPHTESVLDTRTTNIDPQRTGTLGDHNRSTNSSVSDWNLSSEEFYETDGFVQFSTSESSQDPNAEIADVLSSWEWER